jgi:hypothetical protein
VIPAPDAPKIVVLFLEDRLRLVVLPLQGVQTGEVVLRAERLRVVVAEHAPLRLQESEQQRLRLVVAALLEQDRSQTTYR